MHLGLRPRVHFPASYKSFSLVRTHGRVYAAPPPLDAEQLHGDGVLFSHPAVISATTLEELQSQIDAIEVESLRPQLVEQTPQYDLVRHREAYYAIPRRVVPVDLDQAEERQRQGILRGESLEDLQASIRRQSTTDPVEFAGWLPIYVPSGNCGRHPQFAHTAEPPSGYHFTCSAPERYRPSWWWKKVAVPLLEGFTKAINALRPLLSLTVGGPKVGLRARLRTLGALTRLTWNMLRNGCRPWSILRFVQTRHLTSQMLLSQCRQLNFLTSMPYTFGQNPWIIEIEDPTTLFYPMIQNGHTSYLDIRSSPYLPILRTLLEAPQCKGIVTHMRSTAELLPTLFQSEIIRNKVFYAPLGVKVPTRWQRHEPDHDPDEIHLLFINSWCQEPSNFYLRGGLDVLEAFATLRERYPQLRLTIRSYLPALADEYHRILESGWVRVINRFMSSEEMADLHARSHIYLLPAARVHIVSLLQAMSFGLPVVASDGWGFDEYVEHERNALIVRGRYGKVTWADHEVGLLREDYQPMYTSDPDVVAGIVEAVSRLVEDRQLRARLGRTARQDVETKFNLKRWNAALKTAFDRALGKSDTPLSVGSIPVLAVSEPGVAVATPQR